MIGFGVGALALLLAALGFVMWGWRARTAKSAKSPDYAGRLQPYRDRQAELVRELELGNLDDATFRQLQGELRRRLLEENPDLEAAPAGQAVPRWVWMLAGLLPVAALLLYNQHGDLAGWQLQQLLERNQRQLASGVDNRPTLDQLGEALRSYIAADGQRLRARHVLAQVELERGRMAAAAEQYATLAELQPDDAGWQAQAAQAAYLAGGQRITAEIRSRVDRALALDANQPTALGLAGIDAFERQRYADALDYWQRLLAQLPPGAPGADVIQRGVDHARSRLGDAATAEPVAATHVEVAVALGDGVAPDGTLFVFARIPGERMPLAAVRIEQPSFPLRVRLDDSNAMSPDRRLSQAREVEIVARLSRSGEVQAGAGDAQARSEPLALGSDGEVALEMRSAAGGA